MISVHQSTLHQISKEYNLKASMVYILSALCLCAGDKDIATTTQMRKVLYMMNTRSFYEGLKELRERSIIEVVGKHTPKGRTATKYSLTGHGLMIVRSYHSMLDATTYPDSEMVA